MSRRNHIKFSVGSRVSVPRTHFDNGGSSKAEFSQLIPSDVNKLIGTVHRVYAVSQRAYIQWDCDGRYASI